MRNQAAHEWYLPVSRPEAADPAERDGDLSAPVVRGCDCPCCEPESAAALKVWGGVLFVVAVAFWLFLGWAILKWG